MDSPSDTSPAAQLLALALSRPPALGGGRFIAIDGPAGAGKTTLAAGLAALAPATVVHMDDLYAGWDGLPRICDQLETLLRPLAAGRPGRYRRYDWNVGAFAEIVTVLPSPLLVVEGVGSGAGAYADLQAALAWVEAPYDLRMQRGIARDGEAFAVHWERWARDEQALFAREGTRERADLIVPTGRGSERAPERTHTPTTRYGDGVTAPTGEQFEITHGAYRAIVTQSGAALRLLTHDGVDLVHGFPEDEIPQRCRGQMLMPWPNRIRDGRYTWAGEEQQLALTEPKLHNAIHGLVRWVAFAPVEATEASITLGCRLMAQTGYPGTLDVRVTYALDEDGLTVTQEATNVGPASAPYASGAHPYLTLPQGKVDDWTLQAPASTRYLSDERSLPIGSQPVEGTDYDFRDGRAIGSLQIDHCFTDLTRDDEGIATVRLSHAEAAVSLWLDSTQPWLMIFSDDGDSPTRQALAVEPMTAPVEAFNTGEGVVDLAPGATFSARWGIRVG